MKTKFKCVLLLLFITFFTGFSQEVNKQEIAKLKKELIDLKSEQNIKYTRLEQLIDEIKSQLGNKEQEDELQKLLDEANSMSELKKVETINISKKFSSGTRKQQGLNPNISLGGDFFAAHSTTDHSYVTEFGTLSYGSDGFDLREAEFGLVAPLDPFTRGKAFFSFTKSAISVEEAYFELLNLPLNMNLKAGIIYAEFGPLNRHHDHALPQFDRPRALVNYFSNRSLGGAGIAANFMLPTYLFSDASSLDLSVIKGGFGYSFTDNYGIFYRDTSGKRKPIYVAHIKNYYDLTESSYFEYSLNGSMGKNDMEGIYNTYVTSIGLTYKWVPVGRARYKAFDWKTEFFYGLFEKPDSNVKSKGFYTSIQNRINSRFWISTRFGYSELPYDSKQSEWDFTACIDYWQSEFVFFRLQYQYNARDLFNVIGFPNSVIPSDHSLILQVCWAMGPHKHEAY